MKLKFIGLAASLCAVSFSNAMESSQPVKQEDSKYFVKLKESNDNIYIALCLAPKNNGRFSLSNSNYQTSEIAYEVKLPTKLPVESTLSGGSKITAGLNANCLTQLVQFSNIFRYLGNCSGDKNKVLEIACDYERQLAYFPFNDNIREYSNSLWNNYFESANLKYMNLYKLQTHLYWKIMNSLGKLEFLSAAKQPISNANIKEAQAHLDLYSKFILAINDLQEKKTRSIAKDFRAALRKEYITLSTLLDEYSQFGEDDKLPSKVVARMPGLLKFRDSLESRKRSNSTGSNSDEKKSDKRSSDLDNNNNNNN